MIGNEAKGIAYFALGIAVYSVYLAIRSDKKMKAIANSIFMEIYEDVQDGFLRVQPLLQNNNPRDNNLKRTFIWKYRHCLMRAKELKEYASEENQLNLVLCLGSVIELNPWNKKILNNSDIEFLLDIYLTSREFKQDEKTKDKLKKLVEKYIIKKKNNEDLITCIARTIKKLKKTPNKQFEREE